MPYLLLALLLATPLTPSQPSSVHVRASIVYESGEAVPVAGAPVRLLRSDPGAVVDSLFGDGRPRGLMAPIRPAGAGPTPWQVFAARCTGEHAETQGPCSHARARVASLEGPTLLFSADGSATFEQVAPGRYYIYTVGRTRGGRGVVWSRLVDVPVVGTVDLSNANATAFGR